MAKVTVSSLKFFNAMWSVASSPGSSVNSTQDLPSAADSSAGLADQVISDAALAEAREGARSTIAATSTPDRAMAVTNAETRSRVFWSGMGSPDRVRSRQHRLRTLVGYSNSDRVSVEA